MTATRQMHGKIDKTDDEVHQGVTNMVNENKCQCAMKVEFHVEFHAQGGVENKWRRRRRGSCCTTDMTKRNSRCAHHVSRIFRGKRESYQSKAAGCGTPHEGTLYRSESSNIGASRGNSCRPNSELDASRGTTGSGDTIKLSTEP